jgi:hypothetical protein
VVRLKDATARVQRIRTRIKPIGKKQIMASLHARLGIPGGIEPCSQGPENFFGKKSKNCFLGSEFLGANFEKLFGEIQQARGPDRSMPTQETLQDGSIAKRWRVDRRRSPRSSSKGSRDWFTSRR